MSRSLWNHESNSEQGRVISRTGSNHESNRVEQWFEQGRILSRTGSNHESHRVES